MRAENDEPNVPYRYQPRGNWQMSVVAILGGEDNPHLTHWRRWPWLALRLALPPGPGPVRQSLDKRFVKLISIS